MQSSQSQNPVVFCCLHSIRKIPKSHRLWFNSSLCSLRFSSVKLIHTLKRGVIRNFCFKVEAISTAVHLLAFKNIYKYKLDKNYSKLKISPKATYNITLLETLIRFSLVIAQQAMMAQWKCWLCKFAVPCLAWYSLRITQVYYTSVLARTIWHEQPEFFKKTAQSCYLPNQWYIYETLRSMHRVSKINFVPQSALVHVLDESILLRFGI